MFGEGDPKAVLVFVGEGPGQEEDEQGRPFVGAAGQLLTDIIVKGMKLAREDVYICNIVKCRPPGNRNPEPDEIEACEPFLKKQLQAINPGVIVALGNVAVKTLLKTGEGITSLRGKWRAYNGIPLMPTFHPAYLLRNPRDKKLVWEDIQQVMEKLGMKVKHKEGEGSQLKCFSSSVPMVLSGIHVFESCFPHQMHGLPTSRERRAKKSYCKIGR